MTRPDHADRTIDQIGAPAATPPATPRWVKIAAGVVGLIILAVVLKITVGGGASHGPGMHGGLGGGSASAPVPALATAYAPGA